MNYLAVDSRQVMAQHGKSFYFASLIFSKKSFQQVSQLYAFCRYVDDCADELATEESKQALSHIRENLQNKNLQTPLQKFIQRLETSGVQRKHMHELLQGAEFDAYGNQVVTEEDFLHYCYLVAGVVGLMMCPLLGVKNEKAYSHAKSLGIGMQITNICRDILEDAQNGRIYLPHSSLSLPQLAISGETSQDLRSFIQQRLDQADKYYVHAYQGLAYIPLRPRLCILLAGEVYRSIGVKIRQKNYNVLQGRVYLNLFEKIQVAIKTMPHLLKLNFWKVPTP